MSASVAAAQNIKWSEFNSSNISFSKPSTRKDGTREVYLNYGKGSIIVEAPKLMIKFFNANPNMKDATKMNYSISVARDGSDSEFYKIFGTQLNEYLIGEAVKNSVAWFGKEMANELVEDIYKPLYKDAKEGTDYPPMLTLKFYDNQVADMFIDKDNQSIGQKTAKELEELLARDTYINAIFKISSINVSDKAFRPRAELVRCRIIERGTSSRNGVDISTVDISSLKLGKPETLELGGKRTRLIGKTGSVCLKFKGVRLAPYPVESTNDKGETMYSINMVLESEEQQEFFRSLDTMIKKDLVARSVEFYGKKRTMVQVDGKYISQLHYSKKDRDEIAAGRKPMYPPTLKIKVLRNKENTDYAGLVQVKPDGSPFEGDINQVIPSNRDRLYEIDITCRHVWFGKDGESVGWMLNRIVIDDSGIVAGNIRFSDEDEDGDVSGDGLDGNSKVEQPEGIESPTRKVASPVGHAPDSSDGEAD